MVYEKLTDRVLFRWAHVGKHDPQVKALVDRAVRKVVLVMQALIAHGYLSREEAEDLVIKSFEDAEWQFCGLSKEMLMTVVDWEIRNEKGRREHH